MEQELPPANGPLVGPIPKTAGFPPMGAHAVRITAIVEHFDILYHPIIYYILNLAAVSTCGFTISKCNCWLDDKSQSLFTTSCYCTRAARSCSATKHRYHKTAVQQNGVCHCSNVVWFFVWMLYLFTSAFLKHPRTPTSAPGIDYQSADSEHLMKRMRVGQPDEVFGWTWTLP